MGGSARSVLRFFSSTVVKTVCGSDVTSTRSCRSRGGLIEAAHAVQPPAE
jgi:hypothetical protein